MKNILIIIFVLVAIMSRAQVYTEVNAGDWVVTTVKGDSDIVEKATRHYYTYTGTGALVGDTVFYIPSSAPNDTIYTLMTAAANRGKALILQERGSERDTSIIVSQDSLIFGSYGSGVSPKIYGSEILSGWTKRKLAENIYVTKANLGDTIFQLFANDYRQTEARYPNDGYDYIETVNSTSSFTSNELNAAVNYTGAKWIGRTEQYKTPTYTVTNSVSKTLTLNAVPDGGLTTNTEGFILVGKFELLDEAGEWYYNPATDSCYFWAVGNVDPDTYESVRASIYDDGVLIDNKDNVTIKNLQLLQQKNNGVNIGGGTLNAQILRNTIKYADKFGINARGAGGRTLIDNNSILGSNHGGICLYTGEDTISNNIVDSTAIYYSLNGSGMGLSFEGSGIYSQGDGSVIKYNRVLNSGYNGIHFEFMHLVDKNFVQNSNLSKDDGGGIYTSSADTYPNPRSKNSVVSNNIVDGSYGTFNGFTTYPYTFGEGIYIDQWAGYVTVINNVVANTAGNALYSHYGYNNYIQNNLTYRNKHGIFLKRDGRSVSVKHNDIYGFSRDYNDDQSERMAWAYLLTGTPSIDSNRYVNHYKTDLFMYNATTTTFVNWKDSMNMDDNSVLDVAALTANYSENLVYNDTKITKTFYLNNATNITDAFSNASITTSFNLSPFAGKVIEGLNPDCVQDYSDNTAPTITAFDIPATGTLTIAISTFTATGTPTKYKLTETATTPTLEAAGWTTTVPTTYAFSSPGGKRLYAWVRDTAGNISASASDTTTVTVDVITGLIAWYDMEDNGTALIDESANTLNGVNKDSGGSDVNVTAVAGLPGNAYPYISTGLRQSNIADEASTDFTGEFTIYAWINVASLAANRTIIAKNTEFAWIITTAGVIQMRVFENGGANYVTISSPSSTIATGTDYLVEVHCNGGNTRDSYSMSVNRSAVTPTYGGDIGNLTLGIANTSADINIAYFSTLTAAMNGNISQLIIYDYDTSSGLSDAIYNDGDGVSY